MLILLTESELKVSKAPSYFEGIMISAHILFSARRQHSDVYNLGNIRKIVLKTTKLQTVPENTKILFSF